MKHTLGPWLIKKASNGDIGIYNKGAACVLAECFSDINCVDENNPHTEANAKLIAAAPELLKALKAVINRFGEPYLNSNLGTLNESAIKRAVEVIKKAEA